MTPPFLESIDSKVREWIVAEARKQAARVNLDIAIQVAIDADPDRADMYREWQRADASSK